jgi:hypothetical protein
MLIHPNNPQRKEDEVAYIYYEEYTRIHISKGDGILVSVRDAV